MDDVRKGRNNLIMSVGLLVTVLRLDQPFSGNDRVQRVLAFGKLKVFSK